MSKAKKFIDDCTRNCSNVVAYSGIIEGSELRYHEWLTPDQALKAVEITREEMIDKFCEWVKNNVTYIHPRKGTEECVINLSKLKEAMKDE